MKLNRKNKLLVLGIALSIYLSYSLAIKKTINYYNEFKTQQELMQNLNNNPRLLSDLIVREKQIDEWLIKNDHASDSFQNELLKRLNSYCSNNNLKIVDFKEPHQIIENETQINSYGFSVEGSFIKVLGLTYNIEKSSNLGFIKHISTTKKMNFKNNEEYIITNIIVQKNNFNKTRILK